MSDRHCSPVKVNIQMVCQLGEQVTKICLPAVGDHEVRLARVLRADQVQQCTPAAKMVGTQPSRMQTTTGECPRHAHGGQDSSLTIIGNSVMITWELQVHGPCTTDHVLCS